MANPSPAISKTSADRAGKAVRDYISGASEPEDTELREAVKRIQRWRQAHAYPLALVTPGVRNWVGREAAGAVVVAQRLKRFDRMVSKLTRLPTMRLTQMEDIAGCRAVLGNVAEVDAVARRIRSKWHVRDTNDYRKDGKPSTGYRGLHIIVQRRERFVEIQLRTPGQQNWAEIVERTSSRLGFALKDGEGPVELLEYFEVASALIWQVESGAAPNEELQRRLGALREPVRPYFEG